MFFSVLSGCFCRDEDLYLQNGTGFKYKIHKAEWNPEPKPSEWCGFTRELLNISQA